MRYLLFSTILLSAAVLIAAEGQPVTYADHNSVATALSKGGTLAKGADFNASGAHRDKAGQVEVHEKETDIIYITDGEATFVTGGTMVGGKQTKTGQWLGSDIHGGESHHLTKGDVIAIPAGTPHWFKEVPSTVSYFVVKVLKP
jgi:mannose-6-phosphate isomerase-like protein (cupin superfamily)